MLKYLIALGAVTALLTAMPTAAQKKFDEDKCRAELSCWAEHGFAPASVQCRRQIERAAKADFRWTDGALEPKLSSYRWHDAELGTITYVGDRLKIQDRKGASVNHIYECDFAPATNTVLDVRVTPGRLPSR